MPANPKPGFGAPILPIALRSLQTMLISLFRPTSGGVIVLTLFYAGCSVAREFAIRRVGNIFQGQLGMNTGYKHFAGSSRNSVESMIVAAVDHPISQSGRSQLLCTAGSEWDGRVIQLIHLDVKKR